MGKRVKSTKRCGYCGCLIGDKGVCNCTDHLFRGTGHMCPKCHVPKSICKCNNLDGFEDTKEWKERNPEKIKELKKRYTWSNTWSEKEGPLNPENLIDTSPQGQLKVLYEMALEIINKKNHDYRGALEDDYANFRGSKALGIHPCHGVLLRMQDKMMRVKTFVDKGELRVKGESVDDALVDIINYCALLRGIIKTEKS